MIFGMMNNPRTPLLSEIARAARLGFDFLDLTIEAPAAAPESTDWSAVHAALIDHNLRVVAHAAPYLPFTNPSPWVRQAALDELRRTLDIAGQLGAPFCTTHFVGWPPISQKHWATNSIDRPTRCCSHMAAAKVCR